METGRPGPPQGWDKPALCLNALKACLRHADCAGSGSSKYKTAKINGFAKYAESGKPAPSAAPASQSSSQEFRGLLSLNLL
jgi:hypothetical protein